jgi:hypothetical protein
MRKQVACVQCGEDIVEGEEVYEFEGDLIDECCLVDWVRDHYAELGLTRMLYHNDDDPFARY